MWLMLLPAFARPPALPTWDEHTVAVEPLLEAAEPPRAPAPPGSLQREAVMLPFEATTTEHAWASEATLTVAIAGEWERRYYVQGTVRAGGRVLHWQQGPFDAPDETRLVELDVPAEAISALGDDNGTVVARIIATDFDGRIRGRWGLEPVTIAPAQGGIQGLTRIATLETWSEAAW